MDEVHDGDTVNVKLDVGFDLTVYARVRVKWIDAPELSTQAGREAATFAQKVLPVGSHVLVTSYGWDKYGGRIDGQITLASPVNVNGAAIRDFATVMLNSKHAEPYNGGRR